MSSNFPPLEALLTSDSCWYLLPDETIAVVGILNDRAARFDLTDAYLSQYHPDLPKTVRAVQKNACQSLTTAPWVNGARIGQNLGFLRGECVKAYDVSGKERYYYNVTDIEDQGNGRAVYMFAEELLLSNYELSGETLTIVSGCNYFRRHVEMSDFEKQFPGWTQRYQLAQSLELPIDQLIAHAFDEQTIETTQAPSTLDNVTFDYSPG